MSDYDSAFKDAFDTEKKNSPYDIAMPKFAESDAKTQPQQNTDFSGNLRFATPFGTIDTRIPLPESVNRRLANFGSGVADYGAAFAPAQTVDEKRRLDAALNSDFAGKALHFGGKVTPALAVPSGGGVIGALAGGAALGALEPVGTGDSRAFNIGTSAALGAAIPAVVSGIGSLARPSGQRLDLARSAVSEGIPVGVSDVSGSKFVKAVKSVLNDTPFIGGIGETQNAAKQAAFNQAIGRRFGENATSLTPGVMNAAGERIGGDLNRIWGNNPMEYTSNLFGTLRQAETLAENMPKADAARITRWIGDLESKAIQQPDGRLMIPGDVANRFQSNLRQLASNVEGMSKNDLSQLRKNFLGEFNQQVGTQTGSELGKALGQYRAFKTIEPLMNSAEAGVAGRSMGDVPAALLPKQIVQQYGSASRSPFGDLPQIGSQFITDRVPQTGGSIRAAIQNGLIGSSLLSGGGGVGALLTGGYGGALAGAGAALGAGAGLQKLLGSPAIAKSVLQDATKRGLLDSPEAKKILLELAKSSAQRMPIAAGAGLLSPALE